MNKIQKLSIEVVNQIAAGEVVERPASVVKELVDNALDSGATDIKVEILKGGKDLIKVTDNGKGIVCEELEMTVVPHATSKLRDLSDLTSIATMGFRGEALASIAAVSKFKIISKHTEATKGYVLQAVKQEEWKKDVVATTSGTTVEVADLFYNVPARQKFLKKDTTEFNHIMKVMNQFAMIYPEISWTLYHNKKKTFFYNSVDKWQERLSQLLGSSMVNDLMSIKFESEKINIKGFISKPNKWQKSRRHQYIFINNRPVKNALVNKAVLTGISHLLPPRFYPVYILKIDIPGSEVDVNVHPRKNEVKFVNEGMVFGAVKNSVHKAMNQSKMDLPQTSTRHNMSTKNFNYTSAKKNQSANNFSQQNKLNLSTGKVKKFQFKDYKPVYKKIDLPEPEIAIADSSAPKIDLEYKDWKVIGQISQKFLVVELVESLLLIDQHALAEGILYNKLKIKFDKDKTLNKQNLLIPVNLDFTSWQKSLVEEFADVLQEMGFEIEPFGGNTYVLQSVPADVSNNDPEALILDLLNDLALEEKGIDIEKKRDRVIKYTACRSAIKFGDQLSQIEMENLISGMFEYSVHTCAHGRPVYWEITYDELLKKFQR